MIAFAGHDVTYADRPAGSVLFAETEDGVCFVWKRMDGVSERQDCRTAEEAERTLCARVQEFYKEMN